MWSFPWWMRMEEKSETSSTYQLISNIYPWLFCRFCLKTGGKKSGHFQEKGARFQRVKDQHFQVRWSEESNNYNKMTKHSQQVRVENFQTFSGPLSSKFPSFSLPSWLLQHHFFSNGRGLEINLWHHHSAYLLTNVSSWLFAEFTQKLKTAGKSLDKVWWMILCPNMKFTLETCDLIFYFFLYKFGILVSQHLHTNIYKYLCTVTLEDFILMWWFGS